MVDNFQGNLIRIDHICLLQVQVAPIQDQVAQSKDTQILHLKCEQGVDVECIRNAQL